MMKPVNFGPFPRGLDASTGVLSQPKGTIPRVSNYLLNKRGALKTCDGSALVNAYKGVPTMGRGRAMAEFFYQPTGVAPYYLRLLKALDQHLGAPAHLTISDGGAGGGLAAGTYFYTVTALDGVGGETTASNVVSITIAANHKPVLVWNIVPNAISYNIYRGAAANSMTLLTAGGLPIPQPSIGTLTATFTDGGAVTAASYAVSTIDEILTQPPNQQPTNQYLITIPTGLTLTPGTKVVYVAGSLPAYNGTYTILFNVTNTVLQATGLVHNQFVTGQGGTLIVAPAPPVSDTTQQTALYAMPPAANGIAYSNANIVALYPADYLMFGGGPGGGGGRGGSSGSGGGQQGSTPAGGVAGNLSLIPEIVQFTNQAVLALGNGFPPQIYSDPNGTSVNPATAVPISSISVDAFGVVTVTTSSGHNINTTQGIGANVIISGVANPIYNTSPSGSSAFPTIAIPSGTSVKIVNPAAIGAASSSGGTLTVSSVPIISTFVPSYPVWTTAVNYSLNSIIVPTVSNGHYYKAIQAGTSGASQPTFPTITGGQVADGQVIWRESGLLNTAAPPPPGCAHVVVYSGSLWMFNTSPISTSTGIDGPTSLRMSDVNNANSWNPINQAFLDKDDGTEGMGMSSFTITAQGIPPQGSLVAYKLYAGYQIIGVFGSSNFAIQRIQSDMGLVAPRTLQFAPGFGLIRQTHLGYAVYDGVSDRVISQQIQPYLYSSDDPDVADIASMDPQWMAVSQSAQTANPPMYVSAIPVGSNGSSNATLTRILCFDLVFKAWMIVDLPFAISTLAQARSAVSPVVTLLGSFSDGTLQRWQAGDSQWATVAAGINTPSVINGYFRTPSVASDKAYVRLYARRVIIKGQQILSSLFANVRVAGVPQGTQPVPLPSAPTVQGFGQGGYGGFYGGFVGETDLQVAAAVGFTHDRFDCDFYTYGQCTVDSIIWDVQPKPTGVLAGAIS